MKWKKTIIAVGAAIACTGLIIFATPLFIGTHVVPGNSGPPHFACLDACSLVIEPDDGIAPVRAMIQSAARSVDLVMYELEDRAIESDLVAARKRGVVVRVLLSTGYEGEPSTVNQAAYDSFYSHGVAVRWTPDHFALTHEKSLVVDGTEALIMSFNLVPKYYPTGRDFGIVDRDSHDVAAIEGAFNADWEGSVAPADAAELCRRTVIHADIVGGRVGITREMLENFFLLNVLRVLGPRVAAAAVAGSSV